MASFYYLTGSEGTFRYEPDLSENMDGFYGRPYRMGLDFIYGSQYSDTIQPIFHQGHDRDRRSRITFAIVCKNKLAVFRLHHSSNDKNRPD